MIEGFATVSLLLAAALMVGAALLGKVKNAVMPSIRFLFVAAVITIICYVAVTVDMQGAAVFAHGMYFAFTDWLVIALMLYSEKYTEIRFKGKALRIVIYGGAALDTLSMIVNTFTRHAFDAAQVQIIGGETCFAVSDKQPMYHLHFCLCMRSLCWS